MPQRREMEVQIIVKGRATLVAALPYIPMAQPIKIWSTRLYAADTNIPNIQGTANFTNSLEIGSYPRGFPAAVLIRLSFQKNSLFPLYPQCQEIKYRRQNCRRYPITYSFQIQNGKASTCAAHNPTIQQNNRNARSRRPSQPDDAKYIRVSPEA